MDKDIKTMFNVGEPSRRLGSDKELRGQVYQRDYDIKAQSRPWIKLLGSIMLEGLRQRRLKSSLNKDLGRGLKKGLTPRSPAGS